MKHIAFMALALSCLVMGCANAQKARQDELQRLESRMEMLSGTLAICDAELAKDGKYVVRAGDTLYEIGKQFGLEWRDLARMNPDVLEGYPATWNPGLVLKIPKPAPDDPSQETPQ